MPAKSNKNHPIKKNRSESPPVLTSSIPSLSSQRRAEKFRTPPTHLPKISSSIYDPILDRLTTPLASSQESYCTQSPVSAKVKISVTDFIQRLDSPIDEEPVTLWSLATSTGFVSRKYKQSADKYLQAKMGNTRQSTLNCDLPLIHPNHRNPNNYLERLQTPSPILPSPSPLSASLLTDRAEATLNQTQIENRLKTPPEPSEETNFRPHNSASSPPLNKGKAKNVRIKPSKPSTITSDILIDRLLSPNHRDYLEQSLQHDGFYFPDFDDDITQKADDPAEDEDVSFIPRLTTPLGLPFSRPFSRLNDKIPYYITDSQDFLEDGITDIKDYNNNLISLTDAPYDYSSKDSKYTSVDGSISAPTSKPCGSLKEKPHNLEVTDPCRKPARPGGKKHSIPKFMDVIIERHPTDVEELSDVIVPSNMNILSEIKEKAPLCFTLRLPEGRLSNPHTYKDVTMIISPNYICQICLNPLYKPVSLPCSHTFCAYCIRYSMLLWQKKCPICKHIILAAPHVNAVLSDQISKHLDVHASIDIGDTVCVLVSSGNVPAYSCGIIISIQPGFSVEGQDGLQVRLMQTTTSTTLQKMNMYTSKTSCQVALVQCGQKFWQGRLHDIIYLDFTLFPVGTRPDNKSLLVQSDDVDIFLAVSPVESEHLQTGDNQGCILANCVTPLPDGIINYVEPYFIPPSTYKIKKQSVQPPIYVMTDENFESQTASLLSAPSKLPCELPTKNLLRICTDLSAWLSTPFICCVNCKLVARLPIRLKCGCLSCTMCALDCYHNDWPCFSCGTPVQFATDMYQIASDNQGSKLTAFLFYEKKPLPGIPLDIDAVTEIIKLKAGNPYLDKYIPVYIPQEKEPLKSSSIGLLLTDPDIKVAKVMLKSGTVLTTDISRLQPIPLHNLRLALRIQTPLVLTFPTSDQVPGPFHLPTFGLTDMGAPRQLITRYGKYKGTIAQDRSLSSLTTFTIVYNTDSFLQRISALISEIRAHNQDIQRSRLYIKYRKEYTARHDMDMPDLNGQESPCLAPSIPLTTLQAAVSEVKDDYFAEEFATLTKQQEELESKLQLFDTLECSRLSNNVKLLSKFISFDFLCTACTRIVIRPARLPCGHLVCRTCAAIYYTTQTPTFCCGELIRDMLDIKPDIRVLQNLYAHIPAKLHAEQVDCGTYVCKLANCNIGTGIVLNTVSRGGILFATVGFVRYIATFRLAELAILIPTLDMNQFDTAKCENAPIPITAPNNAVGEACIVVIDGPYKNIRGLIVRKNGTKASITLTVVLEIGIVTSFSPTDLHIIKLMGPLCNYAKLKEHAKFAEKGFLAQAKHAFNSAIEESVREDLGVAKSLNLVGNAPPPPKTIYSYMPKMRVIDSRKLLFHSIG